MRISNLAPHKKLQAMEQAAEVEVYKPATIQSKMEGYKVLPPMDDKYQPRDGLEGPFSTLSGKVVYYDPKEGSYYDPDTDIYLSYDEFRHYDNDHSGMKDVNEAGGYYTRPVYDMIKQHGIEKVMHELLTSLDADVIQDFMSRADLDEVNEGGVRPSFAKKLRNAELNKGKGPAPTGKTTGPDDYDFLKYKNKKKKKDDEEVNEGIPKDTSYGVAVDGKYIAKGNKANMRRLAKNTEGGQLMNSPSKKVGDSVGKAVEEGDGLWANINKKLKLIKNGSGEKMRKPGSDGAPSNQDFKDASESIEEEKKRLDPKCWDNKKIGDPKTKMKNGVRVNNCVPK